MVFRCRILASAVLALALGGCAAQVGPVEVTRFHAAPAVDELGRGTIAVLPGPEMDGNSLEYRSFAAAVTEALLNVGYTPASRGGGAQYTAHVSFERTVVPAGEGRSPVSVGVGGSTGSYGSGVGLGIGLDLSGGPKDTVVSELFVAIRRAGQDRNIWEGRADFAARAGAPAAETALSSAKLARALFEGFPGESGRTIQVE